MVKSLTSVSDSTLDPYAVDNGLIVGDNPFNYEINTRRMYSKDDHWSNSTRIAPTITNIPEDGQVVIGDDFIITGKEFKFCMKMLRKMAMEEHPEEFI